MIPATNVLLSLPTFKLLAMERLRHIDDVNCVMQTPGSITPNRAAKPLCRRLEQKGVRDRSVCDAFPRPATECSKTIANRDSL